MAATHPVPGDPIQAQTQISTLADSADAPVIVVGLGPVGVHFIHQLLKHDAMKSIVAFGAEPWDPYNRVKLSELLAGSASVESLSNPLVLHRAARVTVHLNCPIEEIDRANRRVRDALGNWHVYSKLVLSVGSQAVVPDLEGIHLPGVHALRSMNDVQRLLARQVRSRNTIVLGGGLLGLEAAHAMLRNHTRVTLVQRGPWLLNQQLDEAGAEQLQQSAETAGMRVYLNSAIKSVSGEGALAAVELTDGTVLPCDTLIITIGISPNIQLARSAGLSVGRGVRVNDAMQTNDPQVYAVGECTEHRGLTYGMVAPGLEQAGVAANHMSGGEAVYTGSLQAAQLKVVQQPVFSVGRVGSREDKYLDQTFVFRDESSGQYRKLVLRRGRLVGAVAIGPWPEFKRIQASVQRERYVLPWSLWRFRLRGSLWADQADAVAQWPASTLVCNCRGISRGALSEAMAQGATSVAALSRCTGAATVCGSCQPLLAELVSEPASTRQAMPVATGLLVLSVLALLLIPVLMLSAPLPYASSVAETVMPFGLEALWSSSFYKQFTGFTVLGLGVLAMALSLRKRTKLAFLQFGYWRLFHVTVSLLLISVLVVHTGLHLGEYLNAWLMISFLACVVLGAVAGVVTSLESRLSRRWGGVLRRWWSWSHILALWPLAPLLTFHVLVSYYF